MDLLNYLQIGFSVALQPENLFYCFVGVFVGTLIGVLPGIGPVFAGRIVRYRALLGGFFSLDQLHEVYGMTQERFDGLAGRVRVDASLVVPVRINFAGYSQLSRHPYIRGKLAGSIVDWRSANGPFSDNTVLLMSGIVDTVQYRKLNYYLSCQ